jgi:putative hydrolase
MRPLEVDAHTHTIASGHAYGTISEMAKAAAERNIKVLGITEHTSGIPGTCADIYFMNLKVVPRNLFGVELMLGAELNIIDYEGGLDFPQKEFRNLDLRIASMHPQCLEPGTKEQNTAGLIGAICNPGIDIIGHPIDGTFPLDYEPIVRSAAEHHVLLEVNNHALRSPSRINAFENCCAMARLCKQMGIPMVCNSDAHFMTDVGNTSHISPVFEAVDFPEELILNLSAERFRDYIRWNRENKK